MCCDINTIPFEKESYEIDDWPLFIKGILSQGQCWPRGLMDKASDFGSEDCEFESRRGRILFITINANNYTAVD